MGRRARGALTAVALATAAHTAAAQNPAPAAARDTASPQLLFNDVFEPGSAIPARVQLAKDLVYRVEVDPGSATVTIRSLRSSSLPPLLLVPLAGSGPASGTAAYLVVPHSSGEYRLDVVAGGDEPVRIKIWTDPREMSLWARAQVATHGLPKAGLEASLAYFGPFARPPRGFPAADAGGTAPALGAEVCVGIMPRGAWSRGPIGGCALQLGFYGRGSDGTAMFVTAEPQLEITRPAASFRVSVAALLGIGTMIKVLSGAEPQTYVVLGLGLSGSVPLLEADGPLWLDGDVGLVNLWVVDNPGTQPHSRVVPRLTLGLEYRL